MTPDELHELLAHLDAQDLADELSPDAEWAVVIVDPEVPDRIHATGPIRGIAAAEELRQAQQAEYDRWPDSGDPPMFVRSMPLIRLTPPGLVAEAIMDRAARRRRRWIYAAVFGAATGTTLGLVNACTSTLIN